MNKPYTFLFTGKSGCGKGTQAQLLKEYLEKNDTRSALYVYGGKQMREFIEKSKNNFTARLAKEIMLAGKRQPDFLAIWCMAGEIVENLKEDTHLIIDGYPRTLIEAKVIDELFEFYKREGIKPIYLDVSDEWVRTRLLERKRFDDTEERIKNRLEYFKKDVQPVIDYYERESKNRLIRINAEQSIEEVHREIIRKLNLT